MENLTPTPTPSPVARTTPEQERRTQPGRDNALTTLTNYLIVGGMLACASIGAVQLGRLLSPTWDAWYVPPLCFFISLESAYLTRYVRYGKLPVPWYVLRSVEAVVLFLMLRSLLGVLRGPQPAPDVNAGTIDKELLALVIIALVTWIASWRVTSDLLDLDALEPTLEREVIHGAAQAQAESRQSLISFVVMFGVALTFLAGLLRVHWRSNNQIEPPALYGVWHVVIYFFLALVLFSRTRLNLLRSGWMWEHVPIGRSVGARWITYTLLLLGVAGIIALLLPTQYSLGLLGTLGYLLSLLVAVIQTILYALMALILNLLSRLFPDLPPPPARPQEPWPGLNVGIPPPTPAEFIQSLIFWIAFFVIAGYVLVQFLRQHPDMIEGLKRLPGMNWLIRVWRRWREWLGGLNQQIEDLLEARRRARQPAAARSISAPRRWINPRRLSPRQQVRFYYLAMLRRGSEHGHARQPTQTPYEYARTLESQIPEIEQDVDGLTEEFIEARYSRHDVPPEHVGMVRLYWERIKRALRR